MVSSSDRSASSPSSLSTAWRNDATCSAWASINDTMARSCRSSSTISMQQCRPDGLAPLRRCRVMQPAGYSLSDAHDGREPAIRARSRWGEPMGKIWVVDNEPSRRYPIYTRGNVGEVFPEAVAPLSWTLAGIPGAETGWRDAFVRFGAFDEDEFNPHEIEILGVFGGYCYLNVSVTRIFAVRTPGLTPELMDQAVFGASEAPPYRPLPTDESPAHTERIQQTLQWIFTVDDLPELVDDQHRVQDIVARRPDFASLTD